MGLFNWLFSNDSFWSTKTSTYEESLIRAREIQGKKDAQIERAISLYNRTFRDFLNEAQSDTPCRLEFIGCGCDKVHKIFNDHTVPMKPDELWVYNLNRSFSRALESLIKSANFPTNATLSISPLTYENGRFSAWVYLTTASEE